MLARVESGLFLSLSQAQYSCVAGQTQVSQMAGDHKESVGRP